MSVTLHDHLTEFRYEARVNGTLAGTTAYELTDSMIIFTHTVVGEGFEGQGVGGALARYALDDARLRGLRVRRLCPFIRSWIDRIRSTPISCTDETVNRTGIRSLIDPGFPPLDGKRGGGWARQPDFRSYPQILGIPRRRDATRQGAAPGCPA